MDGVQLSWSYWATVRRTFALTHSFISPFSVLPPKSVIPWASTAYAACVIIWFGEIKVCNKFHSSVITMTMKQCSSDEFWIEYLKITLDLYWKIFSMQLWHMARNFQNFAPNCSWIKWLDFPVLTKWCDSNSYFSVSTPWT